MDSRLSQQIATIRTAEALEHAVIARAAGDRRPRRTRKSSRVAARLAHRWARA